MTGCSFFCAQNRKSGGIYSESGLVEAYPHSQLLAQIRYLLNYKYSRFNYDRKTDISELMMDDSGGYQFLKNRHHKDATVMEEKMTDKLIEKVTVCDRNVEVI